MIGALVVAWKLVAQPLLIAGYIGDALLMMPRYWFWRCYAGFLLLCYWAGGLWWSLS